MITNNDINSIDLSATKKDFYQIWNELLATASKLSERWDPTSTNESDPGIVLLKVLTAIADKLNYTIDKNILEAFMPSAAQEESMRKLCEMMGYNMKYYQSATTEITFTYTGDTTSEDSDELLPATGLTLPIFTAISNSDGDVNYVTTESKIITNDVPSVTISCIEGQIVECETDNDNIITTSQLDDDNRYYLPETAIAENGIFVYNISDGNYSERWERVDNLNTQSAGALVYKFGYDSAAAQPYIQFPEDIAQVIEDGLQVYYIRTSGVNGNISARTLSTFTTPSDDETWDEYSDTDLYSVTNYSAATNGADIESITDAYDNYKKVIGTFDTLVTCRDYMNKIYSLVTDLDVPYVSNVIVSDIRDDINSSYTLCSFNDYGICYTEKAVQENDEDKINAFELVLYPFKTYSLATKSNYESSFTYYPNNNNDIITELDDYKTIAHSFVSPEDDDIVCIKNYLKLNARITTTSKVTTAQEAAILANIKAAIYAAFNMRELDFGEEIPFDSILECIEGADTSIKNVSLDEPILYTKFMTADNNEYDLASVYSAGSENKYTGREIYNKLALKNILAGRVELFNYDTTFKYDLSETAYPSWSEEGEIISYAGIYPTDDKPITQLTSECKISLNLGSDAATDAENLPITLQENEVIKFRSPNYTTTITYPAYVNYFIRLNTDSSLTDAIPATFQTLYNFMLADDRWDILMSDSGIGVDTYMSSVTISDESTFTSRLNTVGALYQRTAENTYTRVTEYPGEAGTFYYAGLNSTTFALWVNWIQKQTYSDEDGTTYNYLGLYRQLSVDLTRSVGYLVDANKNKYSLATTWTSYTNNLTSYYVQLTHTSAVEGNEGYTIDGLGKDAALDGIAENALYELQSGEYLLFNYTESSTSTDDTDTSSTTSTVTNVAYGPGTIIRPNFALKDTATLVSSGSDSYEKTSGYNFVEVASDYLTNNPAGMFTLGTSEQIEILEPSQVVFAESATEVAYLYWTLNSGSTTIQGVLNTELGENAYTYTLQDGEYIYYTDRNKTSMAYYGSGTEVIIYGNNGKLIRNEDDEDVSADDIISEGLSAVPWTKFTFRPASDANPYYIVLREYQYVTLTEGDKLDAISIDSESEGYIIDNNWQKVNQTSSTSVGYTIDGTKYYLSLINVTAAYWEIRSSLSFNVGSSLSQTLHDRDSITLYTDGDSDTFVEVVTIKPTATEGTDLVPITIKTNYAVQTTVDTVDTHITEVDSDGNETEVNDFKVKVYYDETVGIVDDTTGTVEELNLHDVGDFATKIAMGDLTDGKYVKLNINIPDDHYGLMMIYHIDNSSGGTERVYLTSSDSTALKIYNYSGSTYNSSRSSWRWWTDSIDTSGDTTKYYLRSGINIILFEASTTVIVHPDTTMDSTVIFSDLDVVDYSEYDGLNIDKLDYQSTTYGATDETADKIKCLLTDIHNMDTDNGFYYNCPMDNSSCIELDDTDDSSSIKTKLSDAAVWYDYNNVNNKFVISEIDANYLSTGIKLANSSKK